MIFFLVVICLSVLVCQFDALSTTIILNYNHLIAHTQDIGCGVGGPARTIGRFSGANIVGLNISDYQIKRARTLTEAANLHQTITFEKVRDITIDI